MNVGDGDAFKTLSVEAVNGTVLVCNEDVKIDTKLNFCCDHIEHFAAVLVVLLVRPHQRLVTFILVGLKEFVNGRLFFFQRPYLDNASAGVIRRYYQRFRVFLCHPLQTQHFQVDHVSGGDAFVNEETWQRFAGDV